MERKERYDFVENKDYISFPKKRKRVVGGTNLWGMKIKTLFGFHKIVKRKERYEFVENQDFIKLHKKMELSKSGTNLWRIKTLFAFPKIRKPKERYEFVERRLYLVPQKNGARGWWYGTH